VTAATVTAPDMSVAGRSRRIPWGTVWRWSVLLLGAVFFLLPLAAAGEFSLRGSGGHYSFSAYRQIFSQPGFGSTLWLSVELGVMTVLLTLALVVPTVTFVHLRLPAWRRVIELITVLPLVIPPVVLVVGVLGAFNGTQLVSSPSILGFEYVILALPFAYRALDAGLRAVDLKTLVEASRSLGGGPVVTLLRVILPNMRTAVLNASVLTLALVLGELAMANLMLFNTFPVWVVQVSQTKAAVSVAVSLLALLLTWALLLALTLLDRRGRGERRNSRLIVGRS
jgi:putative spermidine/putrescine transport system permease protein